jgi:hypothetical protein
VPVEVIALRARAWRDAAVDVASLPAPSRAVVAGPAVVAEADCTVYVADGWRAEPGALGTWVLRR